MLSYRHAFHAGNYADILKHLVLTATLHHATRKEAPVFFLDTHAGAGLYRLDAPEARKTGEADKGILKLDAPALLRQAPDESADLLRLYFDLIAPWLKRGQYPGSPLVAAALLRRRDHLHLCELHPADVAALRVKTRKDPRVQVEQGDGYLALKALIPPVHKRAVILLDPSYELKQDYLHVVRAMIDIHRRMAGAQVLLWYPVVHRATTDKLLASLARSSLRDLWRFELGLQADTAAHGMTACGVVVLNPPWTLPAQMQTILPLLQQQLAGSWGYWRVENLVPE